ncbi:MAG: hypothetical protein J3R72DRAFT_204417 [Linnemannia gamsii]|nr:MAG: hypothetical protein J3R72DRAFT_204417 [Linnemannia gamsii]
MEINPTVLIVGAGIGGLFLANLLQHAGIDFEIFERSAQVKPLGSAMVAGPNILPVFSQLGLLEHMEKISKPLKCLNVYNGSLAKLGTVEANTKERAGYYSLVFARRNLYALLLSQIPPHKIHLSKKILQMQELEDGVAIHCSDKSRFVGDILVGADGAYSGVRQSLYRQLSAAKLLPKHDEEDLSMRYTCLVGTTESLSTEEFPFLGDDYSHFEIVLAKDTSESVACFTIPDNKICWLYTVQLNANSPDERFRNSEWGPEATQAMCDKIRDIKAPFGRTLGELIDVTPKDSMSKVMLEEKLFQTWYHGRTVLIGDACHKMLPSAGQGAINAMQDATILANCINDLKRLDRDSITAHLKDYYDQRYQFAKIQFETSKRFAVIMGGQTWSEALIRKVVLAYMPKSLNRRRQDKTCAYQPQANFLKLAPERGEIQTLPQVPSKRYSFDANAL